LPSPMFHHRYRYHVSWVTTICTHHRHNAHRTVYTSVIFRYSSITYPAILRRFVALPAYRCSVVVGVTLPFCSLPHFLPLPPPVTFPVVVPLSFVHFRIGPFSFHFRYDTLFVLYLRAVRYRHYRTADYRHHLFAFSTRYLLRSAARIRSFVIPYTVPAPATVTTARYHAFYTISTPYHLRFVYIVTAVILYHVVTSLPLFPGTGLPTGLCHFTGSYVYHLHTYIPRYPITTFYRYSIRHSTTFTGAFGTVHTVLFVTYTVTLGLPPLPFYHC